MDEIFIEDKDTISEPDLSFTAQDKLSEIKEILCEKDIDFIDEFEAQEILGRITVLVGFSNLKGLMNLTATEYLKLFKNARNHQSLKIILTFVSLYPLSYERVASELNITRPAVFNSLKKSAENIPWLKVMMDDLAIKFSKGQKNHIGKAVSDETKRKMSIGQKNDWKKRAIRNNKSEVK